MDRLSLARELRAEAMEALSSKPAGGEEQNGT